MIGQALPLAQSCTASNHFDRLIWFLHFEEFFTKFATAYRQREYLTEKEVERLIDAARKRGRNGPRDAAAILLAYRHGLRAAELCALRWTQIDLRNGRLHVNRSKGGIESVHPLHGPELRALRPLQGKSPYVFVTEAGSPVTTAWFLRMVHRTGKAANLTFPSPHAQAFNRIQARQRWPRYAELGALSRASEFAIDGAIHRASACSPQSTTIDHKLLRAHCAAQTN